MKAARESREAAQVRNRPEGDIASTNIDGGNAPDSGHCEDHLPHHLFPRSPPPADRPAGTMIPSRRRPGTSSPNWTQASSLISVSPGNRHLLPHKGLPPLCCACPLSPGFSPQHSGTRARAPLATSVSPHRWVLTAHPAPARLLSWAYLDAQGGLNFLSVVLCTSYYAFTGVPLDLSRAQTPEVPIERWRATFRWCSAARSRRPGHRAPDRRSAREVEPMRFSPDCRRFAHGASTPGVLIRHAAAPCVPLAGGALR